MIEVYGINNCDTVKKARKWLMDHNIDYSFHDFKKINVTATLIENWIDTFSLEIVINKRGTTWRKLSNEDKSLCEKKDTSISVILDNLSVIKRPIVINNHHAVLIGFTSDAWNQHFEIL